MTVLALAAALLWSSRRPPVIGEIEPTVAAPGTAITVVGRNFGSSGRLEIDTVTVSPELIRRWTDTLIVFSITPETRSGLLRVQNSIATSNPVFLTNSGDLPQLLREQGVHLNDIQPANALRGSSVLLKGSGFGPRTGLAELSLAGEGDSRRITSEERWIHHWSDERIDFVVPPEIGGGLYTVRVNGVDTGRTLAIPERSGTVVLGELNQMTIRQELAFGGGKKGAGVVLFPLAPALPEQRGAQLLRETTSSRVDQSGRSALYPWSTEGPGAEIDRITRVDLVARQSVQWENLQGEDSRMLLDPVFTQLFEELLRLPAETVPLRDDLSEVRRRNINLANDTVLIARAVLRTVVDRMNPGTEGPVDMSGVLAGDPADAFTYAAVTVDLARRSGIPARRHYGLLLDDSGETLIHVWVELFLPGEGWIPADPAMVDRIHGDRFASLESFYSDGAVILGLVDGRRLTLSVEGEETPRIYPGAALLLPEAPYAPGAQQLEFPGLEIPPGFSPRWELPVLSLQFN